MSSFLTIMHMSLLSLYSVSSTDCNNYFECESQTITENANCFGYGSCHSSTIESGTDPIYCDGAHSCHSAVIDTSDSTYCRSVASCKHSTLKSSSEIYCEGVESCAFATIDTQGKIYSYGHYGAANAFISGASTVRGYGYYSLLYATIDSSDMKKMSVKMFGVDSGYGANYLCQSGAICSLLCKAGGCLEMDFICFEGSECTVSPQQCLTIDDGSYISEYEGVSCPNWRVSASVDEDNEFMDLMKQKELEKEDNIKYQLFITYTSEDSQSFESEIQNKNRMLFGSISLFGNSTFTTNAFWYLFGAMISFLIIGFYVCGSKLRNFEYHKM